MCEVSMYNISNDQISGNNIYHYVRIVREVILAKFVKKTRMRKSYSTFDLKRFYKFRPLEQQIILAIFWKELPDEIHKEIKNHIPEKEVELLYEGAKAMHNDNRDYAEKLAARCKKGYSAEYYSECLYDYHTTFIGVYVYYLILLNCDEHASYKDIVPQVESYKRIVGILRDLFYLLSKTEKGKFMGWRSPTFFEPTIREAVESILNDDSLEEAEKRNLFVHYGIENLKDYICWTISDADIEEFNELERGGTSDLISEAACIAYKKSIASRIAHSHAAIETFEFGVTSAFTARDPDNKDFDPRIAPLVKDKLRFRLNANVPLYRFFYKTKSHNAKAYKKYFEAGMPDEMVPIGVIWDEERYTCDDCSAGKCYKPTQKIGGEKIEDEAD